MVMRARILVRGARCYAVDVRFGAGGGRRGSIATDIRLGLCSIRPSIGTADSIPEEMDHREIAVRVPVMHKVQLLLPSKPCEPLKPRSFYMVFLVKKHVRVERCRTCGH